MGLNARGKHNGWISGPDANDYFNQKKKVCPKPARQGSTRQRALFPHSSSVGDLRASGVIVGIKAAERIRAAAWLCSPQRSPYRIPIDLDYKQRGTRCVQPDL